MIAIRLSRIGKKNKSEYRLIVQEKDRTPSSRFLEKVGFYHPHTDPPKIELNEKRIRYWLSQGAKASPTVFNILVNHKIVDGPKIPIGRPKKKKEKKEEEGSTKEEKKKKPEEVAKKVMDNLAKKTEVTTNPADSKEN